MPYDKSRPLRGFISYSTKDRHEGAEVKAALAELGVECFLAHDDLRVSEEWKARILVELKEADVFVPLLSRAFVASEWAPQELGFVFARPEVLIVPLMLDSTIPYGLISHLQGHRYSDEITSDWFIEPIAKTFPRQLIPLLIKRMKGARSFRGAEGLMLPLVPLFDDFTDSEIEAFSEACISNHEIWNASLCASEYIPQFIELHRDRMKPKQLKALSHQIEHREVYPG